MAPGSDGGPPPPGFGGGPFLAPGNAGGGISLAPTSAYHTPVRRYVNRTTDRAGDRPPSNTASSTLSTQPPARVPLVAASHRSYYCRRRTLTHGSSVSRPAAASPRAALSAPPGSLLPPRCPCTHSLPTSAAPLASVSKLSTGVGPYRTPPTPTMAQLQPPSVRSQLELRAVGSVLAVLSLIFTGFSFAHIPTSNMARSVPDP